jgi:solute carrier family 13 (sodium-dependent dicarboxylate transporter), member 2/3/5
MPLPGTELAREWVPVVLRLTWRTPPGVLLALVAFVTANEGWLGPLLGLSRAAEVTLGIVVIAAVLWISEAVPLFVTSLLVLALELAWLAPVLQQSGSPTLFLNAFFSDVTLLFLGGFVLSAGLERTGLDRRLAQAILTRAGSTPTRVLLATMLTTALLSMWMSNTAACALMLGLASSMLANVPGDDGFRKALLLGIAFSANLGGIATPIGSPPNAILLRYLQVRGIAPTFAEWVLLAIPLLLVLLTLVLTLLSHRFPTKLETVSLDDDGVPPFGRAQLLVVVVLGLTILGWLFGDSLALSAGTVALLPVMAFFGTSLLRTEQLRALPWDVLLLIGGGLALGAAIDQSGLATTLSAHIPTEGLSEIQIFSLAAILALVLSALMSNTAAANLLAPMMLGLGGVALAPLFVVTAFACSLAMPLPVSTPPNAMAFGFSHGPGGKGALTARDMVVPGLLVGVLGLAALIALATLWFPVILG